MGPGAARVHGRRRGDPVRDGTGDWRAVEAVCDGGGGAAAAACHGRRGQHAARHAAAERRGGGDRPHAGRAVRQARARDLEDRADAAGRAGAARGDYAVSGLGAVTGLTATGTRRWLSEPRRSSSAAASGGAAPRRCALNLAAALPQHVSGGCCWSTATIPCRGTSRPWRASIGRRRRRDGPAAVEADAGAVRQLPTAGPGSWRCCRSSATSSRRRHVTPDVVRRVFELARRVFAAIVVDEGGRRAPLTPATLEHADVVCLVAEPSTAACSGRRLSSTCRTPADRTRGGGRLPEPLRAARPDHARHGADHAPGRGLRGASRRTRRRSRTRRPASSRSSPGQPAARRRRAKSIGWRARSPPAACGSRRSCRAFGRGRAGGRGRAVPRGQAARAPAAGRGDRPAQGRDRLHARSGQAGGAPAPRRGQGGRAGRGGGRRTITSRDARRA